MLLGSSTRRPRSQDIVVVRERRELEALREGWEALARRAARSPLQDFAWNVACAETVDAGADLRVLVVGATGHPVAIAPLVGRDGRLELLGATRLSEPSELLYEDDAALAALVRAMAGLRRPLLLNRLPADSATVGAVTREVRRRGAALTRQAAAHATIALDDGWSAPEGRLSSRRASDVRRARRRAEAQGSLEIELLAPEPDAVGALLDDAFAIEACSWKARAGTALAVDELRGPFFRRYAAETAARGELRIAFLRIGGRRVAMQLAAEWGNRLWLLKIGHDEALARSSPGTLLLLESVRDAAARGLQAVELLGTVEPWTSVWTEDVRACTTIAAFPAGAASVAAAARHGAVAARSRLQARRAAGGSRAGRPAA